MGAIVFLMQHTKRVNWAYNNTIEHQLRVGLQLLNRLVTLITGNHSHAGAGAVRR